MQAPGSPGLGWLQGCPKLGVGGNCGPVSGCSCPREGCSLGKGEWGVVPEEGCSCEPSAANALAARGMSGRSWRSLSSVPNIHPLTYMRSDMCTATCIVAIY